MMTRDEYLARMADDSNDWAPGWEQIDEAFDEVYPGVEPPHLATNFENRAMLGGDDFLDGISFYAADGYQHLVSYGLSDLYGSEESFGQEVSGLGYEMTIKVAATTPEECFWAANSLSNLARYSMTSGRGFDAYQFISGGDQPLRMESDTLLTSYITVPDTEVAARETVHGSLAFVQFVGITTAEAQWLQDGDLQLVERIHELARMLGANNPHLVTDLARASYI